MGRGGVWELKVADGGGKVGEGAGAGGRAGDGESRTDEAGMVIGAVAAKAGMGGRGGKSAYCVSAAVVVEESAAGGGGSSRASGTVAPNMSAGLFDSYRACYRLTGTPRRRLLFFHGCCCFLQRR